MESWSQSPYYNVPGMGERWEKIVVEMSRHAVTASTDIDTTCKGFTVSVSLVLFVV